MDFLDIACIVFACTAANHIGPIPDIERFIKRKLPVVGCVKCLTFWCVLIYCCCETATHTIAVLAIAFLSAWAAIWLDLCMGIIDKLYLKIYDTLYPTTDEADTDTLSADDTMSDVSEYKNCGKTAAYEEDGIANCEEDGTAVNNTEKDNP